jgi:hypothetical protein
MTFPGSPQTALDDGANHPLEVWRDRHIQKYEEPRPVYMKQKLFSLM